MMLAATHLDPVVGIDIHIIQPPGPVPPIPVPHPYVGIVFDPADYVPIIGSSIKVNGMHRAIAGTAGKALPSHIPIGGVFVKPPANEDENFMGSATVSLDGDAAAYMALPCLSCSDIGMPPPPRVNPKKKTKIKSLVLPTSVVLPIPKGPPVLIGGPPTISLTGMAMKLGMAGLGRGLRRLARSGVARRLAARGRGAWRSLFRRMPSGFLKCRILRAEPVDSVTGEVIVDQIDFDLPGRLPINWTRHYRSGSDYIGSLGLGWETPADARLSLEPDGKVLFWDGSGSGAEFPQLPSAAQSVQEPINGGQLYRSQDHLAVRLKGGPTYFFALARRDRRTRALKISAIVDAHNNYWNFAYDEQGDLSAIVESAGRRIEIQSHAGRIHAMALRQSGASETRPLCAYRYDGAGNLVAVQDATGADYTFNYNEFGMTSHIDRGGLTFYYSFDAHGRVDHAWGDGGLYNYTFIYNAEAKWTEVTDSLGHTSTIEYDERGMITRETDPLGGVTQYAYDAVGRTTEVIDPAGRTTLYEYDAEGNLLTLTRPDGVALTTDYDQMGNPVRQIDGNGNAWLMRWDQLGRLMMRVSPTGARWRYLHDDFGDLVRVTDPRNNETRLAYDRLGLIEAITDPTNRTENFMFDPLGKVISHFDGGGFETRYGRDNKGRLVSMTAPSGATSYYSYDRNDNVSAVTDPEGHITRFTYFGQGEVAERHQPDGTVVRYEYDTEERLTAVINETGERYALIRDPLGRVIEEIDYWGNSKRYKYNRAGDVEATKDALDRIIWFEHDPLGRLTKRRFQDETEETFAYDDNGNLTEAINPTIDVTRSYDVDGNMIQETQGDFVLRHEYDATGNRIKRVSPDHVVDYAFDPAGRAIEIRLDGDGLAEMHYDDRGLLAHEDLGPHLQRDYSYTPDGMVARQVLRKGAQPLVDRRYERDGIGSVLKRETHRQGEHHAVEYTYDPMERIIASRDSSGVSETFDYTATGDLLRPVSQKAGTRRSDYNGMSYVFDAAGNLVHRRKPEGDARFEWDAMNRLVRAVNEKGERIEFGYDALGRRIHKETSTKKQRLNWEYETVLSESSIEKSYEFLSKYGSFEKIGAVGDSLTIFNNDINGALEECIVLASAADAMPPGSFTVNDRETQPFHTRYLNQLFDAEIGLAINGYRYFDSGIASFISTDPLGLRPSDNLYTYAPNLFTWIDPLGLACSFSTWLNRAGQDENVFVYIYRNRAGKINYVGITNDLGARATQHGARFGRGFRMQRLGTGSGMPRQQARAVEQALIHNLGMQKNSGALQNLRNEVAPSREIHDSVVNWGESWLGSNTTGII